MYSIIKFGHTFEENIWVKLTNPRKKWDNSLKKCFSSKILTFFQKKNLFQKQEYIFNNYSELFF